MILKVTIFALILFAALSASANAQLLDFDFSFVSDPNQSNVTGTVSGEIIGLANNEASAPTDIIITSAPAGLSLPALSYDLKANGWSLSGTGDTITVFNGVITSADYQASLSGGSFFDLNFSVTNNNVLLAQLNGLEYQGTKYDANVEGFSGVTYTPISAPEPSQSTLLLFGALSLLAWKRDSRLIKSSV